MRETDIKRVYGETIFERGLDYYEADRAKDVIKFKNKLTGEVEGSDTILFQYLDRLLETRRPEEIVHVRMDDLLGKIDSIHDILNTYYEITGIDPATVPVYFLLDEMHVIKDWQLQLKYYIDSHAKCRFIISGSLKTLLYLGASESLAGRIRFIDVFPLTFREYLEFNNIDLPQQRISENARCSLFQRGFS